MVADCTVTTAKLTSGGTTARLGGTGEATGEERRTVQARIATFAMCTTLLSGMFFIVVGALHMHDHATALESFLLAPGRPGHLAILVASSAAWLIARRKNVLSMSGLAALDTLALVGPCLAGTWMTADMGTAIGIYQGLLGILLTAIGRATLVPCTALRTFKITTFAMAGLPMAAWWIAHLPQPLTHDRAAAVLDAHAVQHMIIETFVWCICGVTVATVTSRVIYGLVAQVREARQLGQYTLVRKVGEGGMGQVFVARHALLRRPTAIKLISGAHDSKQIERFEQEVQLTAELSHPNTIAIYDYGRTPDGVFYYAMEYLDGMDLERLVERDGPQPAGRVIHWLIQACGALSEAHDAGLIHRDIKPANLIVCRRGGRDDVIKVVDFGLVKEVAGNAGPAVTAENVLMGTPLYMSPEAIRAPSGVGPASDIYALGCVAYYLLTAGPPFDSETIIEICSQHLHAAPEPPSAREKGVPADLEKVVLACLAKKPEDRPADAAELARRFAGCADAGSWSADEARDWWDKVRAEKQDSDEDELTTLEGGSTVAVELGERLTS
ncbi:serine/threonine protein kinase [Desulfobulbus sp. AH-315-M07]|nr:serine/threonine protein kinase [Desulfobulbus sp. AH-315-M07]